MRRTNFRVKDVSGGKTDETTVKKPTTKDFNQLTADFKELNEKADKAVDTAKKYEDLVKAGVVKEDEKGMPVVHTRSKVGSDEQKCLSAFGTTEVAKLFNINVGEDKFKHVPEQMKGMVLELKRDLHTARTVAQMFYGDSKDYMGATEEQDQFGRCKNILESNFGKNVLLPKLKAFGSVANADWIPTIVASQFIAEFELEKELVGNLRAIPMPSSPYDLPTAGGLTTARRSAENTTMTDSSFSTGKVRFEASKFAEYYIIPEEVNEDTAPGILEFARGELTQAHLRAFETATLNGTKIGTAHIDADTEALAADVAEKQYHGLRKYALDNSANGSTVDFGNAAITDANLRLMRRRMGKLAVNPKDCLWIAGAGSYLSMLGTDNVVTVDKLGPAAATVVTGMLGAYQGIPIIQSGFMREDLNAAGIEDAITVDRTGLVLVHRNRWYFGTRRPIRMALRPSKSADDRFEIASYSRVDFQGHPQTADEVGVVYGFNIPS